MVRSTRTSNFQTRAKHTIKKTILKKKHPRAFTQLPSLILEHVGAVQDWANDNLLASVRTKLLRPEWDQPWGFMEEYQRQGSKVVMISDTFKYYPCMEKHKDDPIPFVFHGEIWTLKDIMECIEVAEGLYRNGKHALYGLPNDYTGRLWMQMHHANSQEPFYRQHGEGIYPFKDGWFCMWMYV